MGCQPPEVSPAVPPLVMPTPRPVPSVLLTTHYLEEAQALASRVVVLAGGRVIAQGGVDDITAQVGLSRVHLRAPSLPELPVGTQVESNNGSHTLYTAHPDGLVGALALQGWRSPGCGWSGPAWSGLPTSDWRSLMRIMPAQFGVGIAEQRATPWERYLRTLPLSGIQRLAGRVQVTCGKPRRASQLGSRGLPATCPPRLWQELTWSAVQGQAASLGDRLGLVA
jgi:hypothetical protein